MPNGGRRHLHANKLRKLIVPVTHVGIISENDTEFGEVLSVPITSDKTETDSPMTSGVVCVVWIVYN